MFDAPRWPPLSRCRVATRGRAGASCHGRDGEARPAELLSAPTPREQRILDERRHVDDLADHRATIAVLVELILHLAHATRGDVDDLAEDMRASLETLAHSEALAREGIAAAALERLMDEVVRFEASCQRGGDRGALRRMRNVARKLLGMPQIKPDRAAPRAPAVVASGGSKRPPPTLARGGGRPPASGGPTA